jgi:hypothetical protein
VEQIDNLPSRVADRIEVFTNDGLLIISLPLSENKRLCLAYQANTIRPCVCSVYLVNTQTEQSQDVSKFALLNDKETPLNLIVNRMSQFEEYSHLVCAEANPA